MIFNRQIAKRALFFSLLALGLLYLATRPGFEPVRAVYEQY